MQGYEQKMGEGKRVGVDWVIRNHPKTDPETIQSLEKLKTSLTKGMSEKAIRAAEERGKTLLLNDVIEEILQRN